MNFFKTIACIIVCYVFIINCSAQAKRDLLINSCSKEMLKTNLMEGVNWVGFHSYKDRNYWASLPAVYQKQLTNGAEKQLKYVWQVVPASTYLEYTRSGNRQVMQKIYNDNTKALESLVLGELVDGKGRFINQIIDGVWTICEMSTWALSAHLSAQKAGLGLPDVKEPILDLGVGNTAALLAWTHFFFKEQFQMVNPLITKRIEQEIQYRVLQPYYQRKDFWWMAFEKDDFVNNWNVWVNYNVLNCILLIETDEHKRVEGIYKTMQSVDKFINYYKNDGACEEGPAYWSSAGGMLFQYLDLLGMATNKKVDIYQHPLIKNIGAYICNAFISQPYYINFADASAKLNPDAGLIYRYGKATNDTKMMGFGSYLAKMEKWNTKVPQANLENTIADLAIASEMALYPPQQPFVKTSWMAETEIALARDNDTSSAGFYFAAKGGHNNESHNHNDVGNFILYYNGQPALIDIGAETYTRQTFGPERYSIWAMRSTYHNLPVINGIEQQNGLQYKGKNASFNADTKKAIFSLDIAGAYPNSALVNKWSRKYQLNFNQSFEIKDDYRLKQNDGNTILNFMTPCTPTLSAPGKVQLSSTSGIKLNMLYNSKLAELIIEPITVTDERLLQNWPAQLYRLSFKLKSKETTGTNTILVENGALN